MEDKQPKPNYVPEVDQPYTADTLRAAIATSYGELVSRENGVEHPAPAWQIRVVMPVLIIPNILCFDDEDIDEFKIQKISKSEASGELGRLGQGLRFLAKADPLTALHCEWYLV